jgi:hypothetical protein
MIPLQSTTRLLGNVHVVSPFPGCQSNQNPLVSRLSEFNDDSIHSTVIHLLLTEAHSKDEMKETPAWKSSAEDVKELGRRAMPRR